MVRASSTLSVFRKGSKFGREIPSFHCKRKKSTCDEERSLTSKILPDVSTLRKYSLFKYFKKTGNDILEWYENFSGGKEVKISQEKVLESADKLEKVQVERRLAFAELSQIQNKLKDIHSELEFTKRGDSRYVHIITEEHKLLKQEEVQQVKLKEIEKTERDLFSMFSNSVRYAHEKERAQAQKTKYWSLIGSIIGTVLGIIGTSVNNYLRLSELKCIVKESTHLCLQEELPKHLEDIQRSVPTVPKIVIAGSNDEIKGCVDDFTDYLNTALTNLGRVVEMVESTTNMVNEMHDASNRQTEMLAFTNAVCTKLQHEYNRMYECYYQSFYILLAVAIISRILF